METAENVGHEIKEVDETLIQKYGNGGAHAVEIALLLVIVYFLAR